MNNPPRATLRLVSLEYAKLLMQYTHYEGMCKILDVVPMTQDEWVEGIPS